jgi:hypothetical protein
MQNSATTMTPFQQEYRGYQNSAWSAQVNAATLLGFLSTLCSRQLPALDIILVLVCGKRNF